MRVSLRDSRKTAGERVLHIVGDRGIGVALRLLPENVQALFGDNGTYEVTRAKEGGTPAGFRANRLLGLYPITWEGGSGPDGCACLARFLGFRVSRKRWDWEVSPERLTVGLRAKRVRRNRKV